MIKVLLDSSPASGLPERSTRSSRWTKKSCYWIGPLSSVQSSMDPSQLFFPCFVFIHFHVSF